MQFLKLMFVISYTFFFFQCKKYIVMLLHLASFFEHPVVQWRHEFALLYIQQRGSLCTEVDTGVFLFKYMYLLICGVPPPDYGSGLGLFEGVPYNKIEYEISSS